MASEINYREFKTSDDSILSMAIHSMDTYITSQIARYNGELTVDFIDSLEFDALDRAQAMVTFAK